MTSELRSWQIGDVKVTKILENAVPLPIEGLIATSIRSGWRRTRAG